MNGTEKMPVNKEELLPKGAGKLEQEIAVRKMYEKGVDIIVNGNVRRVYSIEEQMRVLGEGREN